MWRVLKLCLQYNSVLYISTVNSTSTLSTYWPWRAMTTVAGVAMVAGREGLTGW